MSVELTPEGRAARNQYRRELYRKNAEREKQKQIAYWNRRGAELKAKEAKHE